MGFDRGSFRVRPCPLILTLLLMVTPGLRAAPPPNPPHPESASPSPPHGVDECDLTPADATLLKILKTSTSNLPVIGLRIGDTRFAFEIAADEHSRREGMGGRRTFPPGTGMLFVHADDEVRRYWMLDCRVDIDVAFIDRHGRITAMHRMKAEPARGARERIDRYRARMRKYSSRRSARYAVELPSGEITRLGLTVGQRLPLPHAALDSIAR